MKTIIDYLTEDTIENEYSKYRDAVTPEEFKLINTADPTARNGYVGTYIKWLVKQFKNLPDDGKKRFPEDVNKYKTVLEKYDKLKKKNKLSSNQKDINRFNPNELYNLVDEFSEEDIKDYSVTKKEYKTVFKTKDEYDPDIIWYVYVPYTKDASCHLGQLTRWCTASSDFNRYDEYFEDTVGGRLYIIVKGDKLNTKYKWQIHPDSEQCMDKNDDPDFASFVDFPHKLQEFIYSVWSDFPITEEMISSGTFTYEVTVNELFEESLSENRNPWAYEYTVNSNDYIMDTEYNPQKIEYILDWFGEYDSDYYEKIVNKIPESSSFNPRLLNYELSRIIYEELDEKIFRNAFWNSVKNNKFFDDIDLELEKLKSSNFGSDKTIVVDVDIEYINSFKYNKRYGFDLSSDSGFTLEILGYEVEGDIDPTVFDEKFSPTIFRNWTSL